MCITILLWVYLERRNLDQRRTLGHGFEILPTFEVENYILSESVLDKELAGSQVRDFADIMSCVREKWARIPEPRVKAALEDLTNYQPPGGKGDSSWRLSSNLWGRIIETVRYMRESLGHSPYSVWTVNPRYTSQKCHVCKERGIRVDSPESKVEQKGGEYFYCPHCNSHVHADINAARNIIHVHDLSAVPERTKDICPTLPNLQ